MMGVSDPLLCTGECYCAQCAPEKIPPRQRLSTEHIGLRFRDTVLPRDGKWRVWLNGIEITVKCWEAFPGPQGFVGVFCNHEWHGNRIKLCRCGDDACSRIIYGVVRVEAETVAEGR